MILKLPEHAFLGQEVEVIVDYLPSNAKETIRFQIRHTASNKDIEVQDVKTTGSPARLQWTVTLPKGIEPPAEVRVTVKFLSLKIPMISAPLRVTPMLSIWAGFDILPKTNPNKQFHEDTGAHQKLIKMIEATKGSLAEISVLAGVRPLNDNKKIGISLTDIEWDPLLFNHLSKTSPHRQKNFAKLVEICHAHKVKVFAGYECIERPGKTNPNKDHFMKFVKSTIEFEENQTIVSLEQIEHHAERIVDFLFKNSKTAVNWDGLGFDIELNDLTPKYKPVMRELYRLVAKKLAVLGKRVSFASLGFIDHKGTGLGHSNFLTQSYDLATGIDNLIVRPMLYDRPVNEDLIKKTTEFALNPTPKGAGLKPHQFQCGFKTVRLKPGTTTEIGVIDEARVIKFIKNVLKQHRIGVIIFMLKSGAAQRQLPAYNDFAKAYF